MIAALAMLVASVVTGTALAVDDTSMDSDTQTVQTDSDTETDDSAEATDDSAGEEVSSDDIDTDSGSAGDEADVDDDSSESVDADEESMPDDDDILAAASVDASSGAQTLAGGAQRITAEQWTTNQPHESANLTITSRTNGVYASSASDRGASVEDLYELSPVSGDYVFWKAVLLGSDGNVTYGEKQTSGSGVNRTTDGVEVTRVRYYDGNIQLLLATGDWITPSTSNNLQLVFYTLQTMSVTDDSGNNIIDFNVSDWYTGNVSDGNTHKGYGIRVQIVDEDTDNVIAVSDAMYYHDDHPGVGSITITENDPENYEIVKITKGNNGTGGYERGNDGGACGNHSHSNPWGSSYQNWMNKTYWASDANHTQWRSGDRLYSTETTEYTYSQMLAGEMNTSWPGQAYTDPDLNDDNVDQFHVVFTVYVRQTTSVQVSKVLDGDTENKYADSSFGFSIDVSLPEGSVLRSSYPVSINGVSVSYPVVAVSDTEGQITGISIKAGQMFTVGGLPRGTVVTVRETSVPSSDLSAFSTAYSDGSGDSYTDGVVTTSTDETEQVTVTNTVSQGEGKLTVTKTFDGLTELTAQQRYNLEDAFEISSTSSGNVSIPTLTLDNATESTGNVSGDSDSVTYTWVLNSLSEGTVVLAESNYQVSSENVVTSTQVNNDGLVFENTASTTVTTETSSVAFVNDYDATTIDVTVTKVWDDSVADDLRKTVTIVLTGTGSESDASGDMKTFTVRSTTIASDDNWTVTVQNLPSQNTEYGEITYTVEETLVGEQTPSEAGMTSNVTGNQTSGFTVKNSLSVYTYGIGSHLGLSKVLANGTLQKDDYKFTLTVVENPDGGMTLYDTKSQEVTVGADGVVETVSNGNNPNGEQDYPVRSFDFGEIVFTKPGTYVVKVSEVVPEDASANVVYDEHVLYVRYVIGDDMQMTRYIAYADVDGVAPDADNNDGWTLADDESNLSNEAAGWLVWTNKLVVTSLPMTGGDTTARNLLLAGGVLVLLSGGAWLLSRRRRV